MKKVPQLLTPKSTYTIDYPQAVEFADKQNSIFWLHSEIDIQKDIQDILVELTPAERHGVLYVLKLFTQYELSVGGEYWLNVVLNKFPRPDIQRMASCFGFFELNVHAPFYNKINEALHLNTDEFYLSYKQDSVLVDRMSFIDKALNDDDLLYSLGVFSLVEGAVLYSNFAFLKHFQANGKNKLKNLVAGINFSVRDENLHSLGGAWLFRQLLQESELSKSEQQELFSKIKDAASKILEHEYQIVDNIFQEGEIEGINAISLKQFVNSRVELCIQNLGIKVSNSASADQAATPNPIAEWFYLGISQTVIHDFFNTLGSQYHRDWNEEGFDW
jgi:ribonucleoside-diphosphate reductase beta chain